MEYAKVGDVLYISRDWKYYGSDKMRLKRGDFAIVTEVNREGSFKINLITLPNNDKFCHYDGINPIFINITDILKEV